MKILKIFVFLVLVLSVQPANAEPKPWVWGWWPGHWDKQDFKPHIDDPKIPHNIQWKNGLYGQDWTPENWIRAKGSPEEVIKGFYRAGIITDQTDYDDVPVLEVGDAYLKLSGQEKRRIAEFMDYVFQVTEKSPAKMFYIFHEDSGFLIWPGRPVGVYTQAGLQLQ
jgi:hypothetical protein